MNRTSVTEEEKVEYSNGVSGLGSGQKVETSMDDAGDTEDSRQEEQQ